MKRTSFQSMSCPVAATLEVVGEWWTLLVVREAFIGKTRFEEFQTRLGIARNILAARLRALVDHGVLERRRYQERPPRFEYTLTEKGRDLYPVIVALMSWGNRWTRRDHLVGLVHRETGRMLDPMLVDRKTGAALDSTTSRLVKLARGDGAPDRPTSTSGGRARRDAKRRA